MTLDKASHISQNAWNDLDHVWENFLNEIKEELEQKAGKAAPAYDDSFQSALSWSFSIKYDSSPPSKFQWSISTS